MMRNLQSGLRWFAGEGRRRPRSCRNFGRMPGFQPRRHGSGRDNRPRRRRLPQATPKDGVEVLQGSDRCHGRWDEGSVKGYTTDWINDDYIATQENSILGVWLEGVTRSSDGRMERPPTIAPDHAAARVGPVLGCGQARARSGSRWLSSAGSVAQIGGIDGDTINAYSKCC